MIRETDLETLSSTVHGTLSTAGDPDYGPDTATFNPSAVHRPDAVLGAVNAEDVQAAVRWAGQRDVPAGIQATGHGVVAAMDQGLLINTSRLQDIAVNPEDGSVTVGAGVRWRQVLRRTVPLAFTAPHGSSGNVGIVGYASGGGLPLMGRALGFATDHVRSFDIVTPDGRLRHVDADGEDAELFVAARGGKGNFGVITAMTLDLVPYEDFYGGGIMYPEDAGPRVLTAFREWTAQLPSDASASLAFLHFPDVPFLPEDRRGTSPVHLRFALFGGEEQGDTLIEPMRRAAAPLLDTVGPMDYLDVGGIHMDPDDPVPTMDLATLLTDLPAELADELMSQLGPNSQTPLALTEIRLMGGALATEPAVDDSLSGRGAAFHIFSAGLNVPPAADATAAALARFGAAVEPYSAGALINFLGPADSGRNLEEVWDPEVFRRLQAAKAAYDPGNIFRFGHTVPLPQA